MKKITQEEFDKITQQILDEADFHKYIEEVMKEEVDTTYPSLL